MTESNGMPHAQVAGAVAHQPRTDLTRNHSSHSQSCDYDFDSPRQAASPSLKQTLSNKTLRSPSQDVLSTAQESRWTQSLAPPLSHLNQASTSEVTLDASDGGIDASEGLADYARFFANAAWNSESPVDAVHSLDMTAAADIKPLASLPVSKGADESSPISESSLGDLPQPVQSQTTSSALGLLQPRDATTASSTLYKMRQPAAMPRSVGDLQESPKMDTGGQHDNSLTAWEFLNAEHPIVTPPPKHPLMKRSLSEITSRTTGKDAKQHATKGKDKGKRRAEVPVVELKVLPTSDTLNMFGSTQTSSNYSLSGKVVVCVRNQTRSEQNETRPHATDGPMRPSRSATSIENERLALGLSGALHHRRKAFLPEIRSEEGFLDAEEFIKERFDDGIAETYKAEELSVQSLELTFTGYALYADHTGRFSACKLVEVTEEVLPQGSIVDVPALGATQEYGIEYTLSIPGWLPASLASRFGGTFYALEARAKYAPVESEQERYAIPSSLLPPRRGSRAVTEELDEGRPASEEPRDFGLYDDTARSSSEAPIRSGVLLRTPKSRGGSMPPNATDETMSKDKETWLKKRAKRLSVLAKSSTSSGQSPSVSGSASPIQQPVLPASDSGVQVSGMGRKLFPSRGFIRAFSDPTIIVIRRCREVVPVPVARLALVGPEGAPHDIAQDPPPSPIVTRSQDSMSMVHASASATETSMRSPGHAISPLPKLASLGALPPMPTTPQRSSSVPYDLTEHGSSLTQSQPTPAMTSDSESSVPMRHFLHRPLLHPPIDAGIAGSERGLPFSLTLSLPSYVATAGPESDILSFAVQIEVGRSPCWADVRQLGGLRLREMELSCVQTERHCSVPSRSFCNAYPLPVDSIIGPYDLPLFDQSPKPRKSGRVLSSSELRLRRGYDLELVNRHVDLVQNGRAPSLSENNVERVRTVVVGPPPTQATAGQNGTPSQSSSASKPPAPTAQAITATMCESALTADVTADRRNGSSNRGRRAYQSALRGLSNFATAVMDISLDTESPTSANANRIPGVSRPDLGRSTAQRPSSSAKKGASADAERTALYSFAGTDGHGVDLTKGRVRMSIKLPLVTSSSSRARAANIPCLLSDFEGPYAKIRHKLQVKLSFGFGSKPLGGEGNWGQSLVMCVPVRFTDAAPKEVREQFAPKPIRHVTMPAIGSSAGSDTIASPLGRAVLNLEATTEAGGITSQPMTTVKTPVLPSYNQLFREDGSRLADDGEDLPRYRPRIRSHGNGSVTDSSIHLLRRESTRALEAGLDAALATVPSASTDSARNASSGEDEPAARRDSLRRGDGNRLVPVEVLDESILTDDRGESAREQQRQELAEMQRDVLIAPEGQATTAGAGNATGSSDREDSDSDGPMHDAESTVHGHGHNMEASMSATVEQTSPVSDDAGDTFENIVDVDQTDIFAEMDGDDVPHFAAPQRSSHEQTRVAVPA